MTAIINGTLGYTFPDGTTQTTAAASRSGVTAVNLSSDTPNDTLTSASNQLVVINATAAGCSVTLPNMTTVTPTGDGYFTLYNTSEFTVVVKDSGGTIRDILKPNTLVTLELINNSTATGVWTLTVPTLTAAQDSFLTLSNLGDTVTAIIPVTDTQFVMVYSAGGSGAPVFAKLGTINTTTKEITFGTATTLYTTISRVGASFLTGASDSVSRGVLVIGEANVSGSLSAAPQLVYYGFSIVSNDLYFSTKNTGVTGPTQPLTKLAPVCCDYLGSNNSFFIGTISFGSSGGTHVLDFRQFTVNVAGTTVTITNATGNGSVNSATTNNYAARIGKTSTSSYVYDIPSSSGAFSSGGYVSCDAAANTLTKGARTTQNTAMMINHVNIVGDFFTIAAPTTSSFIQNSAGTRTFNNGYFSTIANAGTATVTASVSTDITYKEFSASSYITLNTLLYPLGQASYYYNSSSYGKISGKSISSTSFIVMINDNYYTFDPTSTTFNINAGVSSYANVGEGILFAPTAATPNTNIPVFFTGNTMLSFCSSNQTYDFLSVSTPIKA